MQVPPPASASGEVTAKRATDPGMLEKVMESSAFKSAMRSAGTVIGREITRSIFGTGRRPLQLAAAELLVHGADDRRHDRSRGVPGRHRHRLRRDTRDDRILLRSKPSSDILAVYSVEIHRKSGISFSTSDCSL